MYQPACSFLRRLRRDNAGNTLAIAAAALLPLIAMVGGAVDMSRYYMATARLQNACDAGALAARKSMSGDNFTTADRSQGLAFFDQNYPAGTFGMTDRTRNYTADGEGTVTGTASGQLPTSLMHIFGHGELSIDVSCEAEINISNTDIMFVLDVTGSMNCPPGTGGSCGNVEQNGAKIRGLRTAVLDFYDAVEDASTDAAQVRYGIVPYASNVNVGASIPVSYLAPSHTYQSREPQWEVEISWETLGFTIDSVYDQTSEYRNGTDWGSWSRMSEAACIASMPSADNDIYIDDTIDSDTLELNSETTVDGVRTREMTAVGEFYRGVPTYQMFWGWCRVGYERYDYEATFDFTIVEEMTETRDFDGWVYKPVTYSLTDLYANGSMTTPTGNQGADVTHTWTGCIEEATTVTDAIFDPVPSGAYDLDINLKPSNANEYWKPQLPLAVYKRESGYSNTLSELTQWGDENRPGYDCPTSALRLSDISRDFLEDYLDADNGFDARSNTYHDIGMIWGARFISPTGMFAADNATAPNGDAIARHIVFMTDGTLQPNDEVYGTYGVEWWDRRVRSGTSDSDLSNRHAARFQAACKAARLQNISVWVVAFGTSLSQNLEDCATPGRAYHANDSEELSEAFEEIAEKIAALRLTN